MGCDSDGQLPLDKVPGCRDYHERKISTRKEQAKALNAGAGRTGTGLILTEMGACPESQFCYEEISAVTDVCDEHLVSWAYWMFKGFGDFTTQAPLGQGLYHANGSWQQLKKNALTRSYAQKVQGISVEKMVFDRKTGSLMVSFFLPVLVNNPLPSRVLGGLYPVLTPAIKDGTVIFFDRERWSGTSGSGKNKKTLQTKATCTLQNNENTVVPCGDQFITNANEPNYAEWVVLSAHRDGDGSSDEETVGVVAEDNNWTMLHVNSSMEFVGTDTETPFEEEAEIV